MPFDSPLNAVMGPGAHYQGDLSFEGRVRVDGHFKGRIYTEDCLEVGVEGTLDGVFDVARAVVAGTVSGRMRVREHLLLTANGAPQSRADAPVFASCRASWPHPNVPVPAGQSLRGHGEREADHFSGAKNNTMVPWYGVFVRRMDTSF